MKTIAIIGQKGGTGKTTLAQILLTGFEREGFTTVGIDLDPQASLSTWGDRREATHPEIISLQAARLAKAHPEIAASGLDVCVIDTAGRGEQAATAAAALADLVILPFQPTAADLVTAAETLNIVRLAQAASCFAVLMRVKPHGTRHAEAVEFLEGQGIEVCPETIGERVTYQDAAAAGLGPQEYEPHGKAASECQRVIMFTCQHVGMSTCQRRAS